MKYIRTKDGIYEFPKGFTEFNWNNKTLLENEEHIVWTGGEVIAQADTIKELIDEYVCVMPSGETFLLDKNTDLKAQANYVGDVYASIWIDGELHKVATLNDKGELKLL